MLRSAEWRFRAGEHFGNTRIFVVAAEAVEAERSLRFTQVGITQFVEYASEIVEEVDRHLAPLEFGNPE
jgi:hypothetical protein